MRDAEMSAAASEVPNDDDLLDDEIVGGWPEVEEAEADIATEPGGPHRTLGPLMEDTPENRATMARRVAKLERETRNLRGRLEREELLRDFGADVVELLPASLSGDQARDLAGRLKEFAGSYAAHPAATAPADDMDW